MSTQDEIREIFFRYAQAVDRREFDRAASIFAPDCVVHGTFASGPVSEYWPKIRERVEEFDRTMHLVANLLIEETEPGQRASTDTYCVAYHLDRVGGGDPWVVGVSYRDEVAVNEGRWTVVERSVALLWERDSL